MVHAALREVLGPNAVQAGSLNRPGYLRFDFNWQGALTDDQRGRIEEIANEAVQADYPVNTFLTELDRAKAMGAMALFGEQYPSRFAWSRSADRSRWNSAAAPTCTTQPRSDRSPCSATPRLAPGCGGWRLTSGSIRSGT